ncbi:MAG: acetyl-CoA C-acyltransferase, partial [Actinobacteria bacterium]|nr:acetyl-CoA C-acyltransferase [Actinomycetota bacterium]
MGQDPDPQGDHVPPIPRRAVVVGANRIPFAKVGSAYRHASNADMLTA